jgi:ATP-dependent DNA helicase DinG
MSTPISTILAQHGPSLGLQVNPTQQQYADFVQAGIAAARASTDPERPGGQLFAEAETGSGKTIGYLTAAGMDCVEHGSRAIIATHTLALQRQVLNFLPDGTINPACDMAKALALVEAETGKRLVAALRVGRRNFVDAERCEAVVSRLLKKHNLSEEVRAQLQDLARWASENPGGEFRDFLAESGLDALPYDLTQEDLCINSSTSKDSPSYQAYAKHATAAKNADIVVTNHAMLVREALSSGRPILSDSDDPRPLGVVVVDECDQMESAARSASSDLLPLREFRAAVQRWNDRHGDGRGHAVLKAMERLESAFEQMLEIAQAGTSPSNDETVLFWDEMRKDQQNELLECIEALGTALSPLMQSAPDVESSDEQDVRDYATSLANIYVGIKGFNHGKDQSKNAVIALRWSPSRDYPSLRMFRLRPARILKSIWSTWTKTKIKDGEAEEGAAEVMYGASADDAPQRRAPALILTSATISVPTQNHKADLSQLSDVFGIYPAYNACHPLNQQGKIFSPKKFGSVNIVFSDAKTPPVYLGESEEDEETGNKILPINPEWVDYQVKIVQKAQSMGGRMLVLTNSYRTTRAISDALRAAGIEPIEKTRNVGQQTCVRRLVADSNGVFISPGAWEGFDISQYVGEDGKKAKLKHVLITQLPFARVDGPFTKALYRHLTQVRGLDSAKADGIIYGNIRAAALRKAKQGFGRGIRGANDHFTLWIGDGRFPRSAAFQGPSAKGVRQLNSFIAIIPKRFRQSGMDDSAWDRGSVLLTDGRLVTLEDLREAAGMAMA